MIWYSPQLVDEEHSTSFFKPVCDPISHCSGGIDIASGQWRRVIWGIVLSVVASVAIARVEIKL